MGKIGLEESEPSGTHLTNLLFSMTFSREFLIAEMSSNARDIIFVQNSLMLQ